MNSSTLIRSIPCTTLVTALVLGFALLTTACIARSADDYRKVTRSLVDTKKGDIESCFGGQAGKVVVDFTVEKKTGKVSNATVDEKQSTASPEVGQCIVAKVEGLTLSESADMRDGAANFTWQFSN